MELPVLLAFCVPLAPAVLGFAVPRAAGAGPRVSSGAAAGSAALAMLLAIGVAALVAVDGPANGAVLWFDIPSFGRLSLGSYVDGLTAVMLLTVTLIGAAVTRFQVRYLDGDPGQARFAQWLAYTLAAVLFVIIASNLAMFFVGWIGTSHGLHRLLTHYPERRAAQIAARKKFLTSRLGDALLLAAFVLIYRSYGSLEFADILPRAADGSSASWIVALLVLGAMTKSAQFPFHTWLPDTMETPTPVSALMHAGIVNAGGFLLIRMSPLLVNGPSALNLLAAGGAFTAVFGAIVMLTQTDVKRKYAFSTVSQMGFMMLQCGLGAFAAATLHLVGHSFYKGYSFLSAGSAVDPELAGSTTPAAKPKARQITIAVGAGVLLVALAAIVLGFEPSREPGFPVLAGILAIALAQLMLAGELGAGRFSDSRWVTVRNAALMALAYFGGLSLMEHALGDAIPQGWDSIASGTGSVLLAVSLVALFFLALLVQSRLSATQTRPRWREAYVHLQNGLYLGALQNRLVEALWPPRPETRQAERL